MRIRLTDFRHSFSEAKQDGKTIKVVVPIPIRMMLLDIDLETVRDIQRQCKEILKSSNSERTIYIHGITEIQEVKNYE